jgi:hypothetical protein
MRFEAPNKELLSSIRKEFVDLLREVYPAIQVPEISK